jgi:iron complex outermembrane receptor protein
MRKLYVSTIALACMLQAQAQQTTDTLQRQKDLQEVVISGVKAGANNPVTFSTVTKDEIKKQNFGQDLPFLLNLTPSTVVSSDAGAGIGYTGIRIRGTDPTRTNVTINGVPINDAESHGMFWVNMPDFASSTQNIQVQRGVGTSSNGAAAFGASINVETDGLNAKPYGEIVNSYGSFNTWKHTVKAGTGLLDNHWAFDARLSKIASDGYMDRASSDLKSYFVSGAWYGEKSMLKANIFSGTEKTYQAWNGVPEGRLNNNQAQMDQLLNYGIINQGEYDRMLASNSRTYNQFTYANQTDNYQQDYYQLFYTYKFNPYLKANIGLHYTYGRGYYEEYKEGQSFATYKLPDTLFVNNDTVTAGNFIRRRWLDNDFYGTVYSFNYNRDKWNVTLGGAANEYDGRHRGELIWAQYTQGSTMNDTFYLGKSTKKEASVYLKTVYTFNEKLQGYVDLQGRFISYKGKGEDLNGSTYMPYDFNLQYNFFNPKVGLTYQLQTNSNLYAYVGMAHKEPVRSDIIQASSTSIPKPEQLINYELGYRMQGKKAALAVNGYYMDYVDQLVTTGEINDVGAYNRVNVAKSYRAGIELTAGYQILKALRWQITATYSQNKIKDFTEYVDDWDNGGQVKIQHANTDIAMSPNWIGSSIISYNVFKGFNADLISKYVGKQYLDNTQNENRKLDAFFVNDLRFSYEFRVNHFLKSVRVGLLVNNIFNVKYEPNGYTWSAIYGGTRSDFNYYYPQAGTNYLLNLVVGF